MSLPQLVGLKCVICQGSIHSDAEGAFCPECGNAVHRACSGKRDHADQDRCPSCGGDRFSAVAVEVRRERKQEVGEERRKQATTAGKRIYPVSSVCPACGHAEYKERKPERLIAFKRDRVCASCETRYTPPTPGWAALVFIAAGLLLAVFGSFGILIGGLDPARIPAAACEGLLGLLGVLAIIHGIRALVLRGRA